MAVNYINKIRTQNGDMPINYEALANLPVPDTTLSEEGKFPDSKTVGEQIYSLEREKASAIKKKTSGTMLTVTDSADLPIQGLKLYGKSKQETTTGAQLFDYFTALSKQITEDCVHIDTDGKIILDGKFDSENRGFSITLSPGTYTLSADNPTIWHILAPNDSVFNQTLQVDEITTYKCYITSGTYDGLITTPMISTGEIVLPWEPYTGGQPSPSPEYPQETEIPGSDGEIEMGVRGKNLYDMSALKYINYSNGIAYIQNQDAVELPYSPAAETYGVGVVVPCKAGVTYTMSIRNPNPNAVAMITEYADSEAATSSGNKIGFVNAKAESVVYQAKGNGVLLCAVAGKWTDGSTSLHTCTEDEQIQVELGDEATSYEPYKRIQTLTFSTSNGFPGIPVDSGGSYTDETGQQWVCDEIDLERGKYIQRVAVESKSGGWKLKETSDAPGRYVQGNVFENNFSRGDIKSLCNAAVWTTWGNAKKGYNTFAISGKNFYFYPREATTAEALNENLNSLDTPVVFLGQLEKPIERDLTQEEIAAYRSLHTNYPITVVTTDTLPQAGIEMEYVADTETFLAANYVPKSSYDDLEARVKALEAATVKNI